MFISQDLLESYFILWRLTRDTRYRELAWEMALAIHKHCQTESGGYSGILDVNVIPTEKDDYQAINFFSQTVKYLYLIFTEKEDKSLFPLNEWIFTTKGHPLPVYSTTKENAYSKVFLENLQKRAFIREMARDAWKAYRNYAWGHEALRPFSKLPDNGRFDVGSLGTTIVMAMSTLHLMKLDDEFKEGRTWIEAELVSSIEAVSKDVFVKDITGQYIGSLLSVYSLSGDELYLRKAVDIASLIKAAFNSSTGNLI